MNFKEFFRNKLLLEANPEKRIAFLIDKYGKKLKDLFTERFTDSKFDASYGTDHQNNYDINDFIDNIVREVDPEQGTYSEWIVRHVFDLNKKDLAMFNEDSYKITEDLEKYHRYKKYFKKAGEDMRNPNTKKLADINQINGFEDLYDSLKVIQDYIKKDEEAAISKELENEVEKIYKSENYLILVPKTKEASCAYGKGTRWCTASTGSYNYFDRYNKDGPLYIIIDKQENEKYQFHFQSEQYMNSDDSGVNLRQFFEDHGELKETLYDLALKNKNNGFIINSGGIDYIMKKMDTFSDNDINLLIKQNAYIALKYGKKHTELVNNIQQLFRFEKDNTITLRSGLSDWTDFIDFFDGKIQGSVTDILEGNPSWIYDNSNNSYEDEYWNWLDADSQGLIRKYIKNKFNHDVHTMADAAEYLENLEDNEDEEYFHDILTRSYDDAYSSALEREYFEETIDSLLDIVAIKNKFQYDNEKNEYTFPGYSVENIEHILNSFQQNDENNNEYPGTQSSNFFAYWNYALKDQGELAKPNFDNIYGDATIKKDGEQFNYRFQTEFEIPKMPETTQLELDLSGINRGMTQFDQFIKKLFEEGLGDILGDMGKNGLANRGGSGTQTSNATSSTGVPQSKVSNGVKMPFSGSTGVKPMNPTAMQNNVIDYGSIFNSKDPNTMKLFMSDPDNIEGFKQHISDPKNREAFSSTIKDPNQWKAIVDMISTPSPK